MSASSIRSHVVSISLPGCASAAASISAKSFRAIVGGVEASDGSWIEAKQMVDGGPSVLYDAVAVLTSSDGAQDFAKDAAAKDFVSDAFAHCKFIAYTGSAMSLLDAARAYPDDGFTELKKAGDAATFVKRCRDLRYWERTA